MKELIAPYGRALKYKIALGLARRRANNHHFTKTNRPPVFVIACGRSGTTLLHREVLAKHPDVCGFFERYDLWAGVDIRTDAVNLYQVGDEASCVMRQDDLKEGARERFERLFLNERVVCERLVVEKTPINAMRVEYLNSIAPGAKFVHIVRDGVDVVRSIEQLANKAGTRIAGRPLQTTWWGAGDSKRRLLLRDARQLGYFVDELDQLKTHAQVGALEWIMSLMEVERCKAQLGDRMIELSYADLTTDARRILLVICELLGIQANEQWLANAVETIRENPRRGEYELALPPMMQQSFNCWQARLGFDGRAQAI